MIRKRECSWWQQVFDYQNWSALLLFQKLSPTQRMLSLTGKWSKSKCSLQLTAAHTAYTMYIQCIHNVHREINSVVGIWKVWKVFQGSRSQENKERLSVPSSIVLAHGILSNQEICTLPREEVYCQYYWVVQCSSSRAKRNFEVGGDVQPKTSQFKAVYAVQLLSHH